MEKCFSSKKQWTYRLFTFLGYYCFTKSSNKSNCDESSKSIESLYFNLIENLSPSIHNDFDHFGNVSEWQTGTWNETCSPPIADLDPESIIDQVQTDEMNVLFSTSANGKGFIEMSVYFIFNDEWATDLVEPVRFIGQLHWFCIYLKPNVEVNREGSFSTSIVGSRDFNRIFRNWWFISSSAKAVN